MKLVVIWTKKFENHLQSWSDLYNDDKNMLEWLECKTRLDADDTEELKQFTRAPIVFFESYRIEINGKQLALNQSSATKEEK